MGAFAAGASSEDEIRYAVVSLSAGGDMEVVAAIPGKRLYVLASAVVPDMSVDIQWKSGTTAISGVIPMDAKGVDNPSYCPYGNFRTATGEALVLNSSSAVDIGGHITYLVAD